MTMSQLCHRGEEKELGANPKGGKTELIVVRVIPSTATLPFSLGDEFISMKRMNMLTFVHC